MPTDEELIKAVRAFMRDVPPIGEHAPEEVPTDDPAREELVETLQSVVPKALIRLRRQYEILFGSISASQRTAEICLRRVSELLERDDIGSDELDEIRDLMEVIGGIFDRDQQIKDAVTIRRARSSSGPKFAKGLVKAGVEFAKAIVEVGEELSFERIFDRFSEGTLGVGIEVLTDESIYSVWRDGEYLYEKRIIPPGRQKQVSRNTFRKKPHYWPEIRKAVSP